MTSMFSNSSHFGDLPKELVFYILEIVLDSTFPYKFVPVLLVSRAVHDWALPQVYSDVSLTLSLQNDIKNGTISSLRFMVYLTPPSSIALVKRLQQAMDYYPFSFAPFKNLTHLTLRGDCRFRRDLAVAFLTLRLEELLICFVGAMESLDYVLIREPRIEKSALQQTLRRYGGFMSRDASQRREFASLFPNITHLLVLRDMVADFDRYPVCQFLARPTFQCCIFTSYFGEKWYPKDVQDVSRFQDRRLVFARKLPVHLRPVEADAHKYFWFDQRRMWTEAEALIRQNKEPQVITLLDPVS
ncbi:hypothetical protein DL96DRAFT_1589851 [Flagelloscypha sp. PMI_526]|nr:hypothetical protein DL96DRAFT_1589851 [Flagelloscypha sp. PMI_526]